MDFLRTIFVMTLLFLTVVSDANAAPKRILLLHSFGRDFATWNEYSKHFRLELDRRWSEPVDLYEASLVTARFSDGDVQGAFAEYLHSLNAAAGFDCIHWWAGSGLLAEVQAANIKYSSYTLHRA